MSKETMKLALEALDGLEALLLSMGLTHLIVYGDAEKAITALREALASEALDRMAENARELGLDYEPVWGSGPTNKDYEDSMRQKRLHQLTSPSAQRTWVGLTRAERFEIEKAMSKYYDYQHECKTVCLPEFARAIEAKLKEKNT